MIDASRWLLVEAWLALGLRLEWCPSYRAREQTGWQECDETGQSYFYRGDGLWEVLIQERGVRVFSKPECPHLGVETMRHELAHYLAASAADRKEVNFRSDDDAERRTLEAEKVIDAMLVGANRIAAMALAPGRR